MGGLAMQYRVTVSRLAYGRCDTDTKVVSDKGEANAFVMRWLVWSNCAFTLQVHIAPEVK